MKLTLATNTDLVLELAELVVVHDIECSRVVVGVVWVNCNGNGGMANSFGRQRDGCVCIQATLISGYNTWERENWLLQRDACGVKASNATVFGVIITERVPMTRDWGNCNNTHLSKAKSERGGNRDSKILLHNSDQSQQLICRCTWELTTPPRTHITLLYIPMLIAVDLKEYLYLVQKCRIY